jgi:hypothetical protein
MQGATQNLGLRIGDPLVSLCQQTSALREARVDDAVRTAHATAVEHVGSGFYEL